MKQFKTIIASLVTGIAHILNKTKAPLIEIFKIYFLIGLQLLGGGYVIMPLLKKYLVEERNWIKEEDLIDYLALSQCLPGLIALNVTIFSGYALRKLKGAALAVFALTLSPFLIILFVANFIYNFADYKVVQDAFFGIRLSIIILMFYMIKDIFKASIYSKFTTILFLLILSLSFVKDIGPTTLVILAVIVSLIRGFILAKKGEKDV